MEDRLHLVMQTRLQLQFGVINPVVGILPRGKADTFAVLTAVQLALAVMNVRLSKRIDDSESVSEDTE